jgi:hypothetical protein
MESDHHYPAILAIQRPPPTLAVRSNDGSAGHPETALQIGIPEGVGGVKGCCGWWCCWGACVWARAGGGAGVKVGRRPPRQGVALTPVSSGAESVLRLELRVGFGFSHQGSRRSEDG